MCRKCIVGDGDGVSRFRRNGPRVTRVVEACIRGYDGGHWGGGRYGPRVDQARPRKTRPSRSDRQNPDPQPDHPMSIDTTACATSARGGKAFINRLQA